MMKKQIQRALAFMLTICLLFPAGSILAVAAEDGLRVKVVDQFGVPIKNAVVKAKLEGELATDNEVTDDSGIANLRNINGFFVSTSHTGNVLVTIEENAGYYQQKMATYKLTSDPANAEEENFNTLKTEGMTVETVKINARTVKEDGSFVPLNKIVFNGVAANGENGIISMPNITKLEANEKNYKVKTETNENFIGEEKNYIDLAPNYLVENKERITAKLGTHYTFAESDDLKIREGKAYVKKAGEYEVIAIGQNHLSKTQGGADGTETLKININSLSCESFFVKNPQGDSKEVKNALIMDTHKPEITSVITTSPDGSAVFKNYGIFASDDAKLNVVVSATDTGIGIKNITLYEKKKNGQVVLHKGALGQTQGTFVFPMEAEALKSSLEITATDWLGHETDKIFLRDTLDQSVIIIEKKKPEVSPIRADREPDFNGWYNKPVTLSFSARDVDSGLYSLMGTLNSETAFDKITNKIETEEVSGEITINTGGQHKIEVKASDNALNTERREVSLKLDLIKPVLTLSGIDEGKHYDSMPTLNVLNEDENWDKEGSVCVAKIYNNNKLMRTDLFPKSKEFSVNDFYEGDNKVIVTGLDAAGNEAEEKTISFTLDRVAPQIEIEAPSEGSFVNPQNQLVRVLISEQNFSNLEANIILTRTLDGISENIPLFINQKGEISIAKVNLTKQGTYHITVNAKDKAGNIAIQKSRTFTLDNEKPVITITGLDKTGYGYKEEPKAEIKVDDSYFKDYTVRLLHNGVDASSKVSMTRTERGGDVTISGIDAKRINDGVYNLLVSAEDKAGNITTEMRVFIVNRYGSAFTFSSTIDDINGKYVKEVKAPLIITERNFSLLKSSDPGIVLDGMSEKTKALRSHSTSSSINTWNYTYTPEMFEREGVYKLNVKSEDDLGNYAESNLDKAVTFAVDKTEPKVIITGLGNKNIHKAKSVDVKIMVEDNMSGSNVKVFLDDEKIKEEKVALKGEVNITLEDVERKDLKIEAKDRAGNARVETLDNITISTKASVIEKAEKEEKGFNMPLIIFPILVMIVWAMFFFLMRKRRAGH